MRAVIGPAHVAAADAGVADPGHNCRSLRLYDMPIHVEQNSLMRVAGSRKRRFTLT